MSCLPFQLDIATVGLSVVYALNMRPERVRCTVVATLNIYLAVSFIRGQITKTYSTDTWTRGERGKSKPVFVRTRRFALSYCFGDGEDGKTDVSAIPRYKTTPSVTVVLFFIFLDRARYDRPADGSPDELRTHVRRTCGVRSYVRPRVYY